MQQVSKRDEASATLAMLATSQQPSLELGSAVEYGR